MKLGYSRFLLSGYIFFSLSGVWVLAMADVPAGQRPNCPAKCGDVDIPFPFGVGEQCALPGFKLHCTTVEGVTKPLAGKIEVIKISLDNGTVTLNTPAISWNCYYPTTGTIKSEEGWLNLTHTRYWISEVDNTVIVIGCNTLAYMRSSAPGEGPSAAKDEAASSRRWRPTAVATGSIDQDQVDSSSRP